METSAVPLDNSTQWRNHQSNHKGP